VLIAAVGGLAGAGRMPCGPAWSVLARVVVGRGRCLRGPAPLVAEDGDCLRLECRRRGTAPTRELLDERLGSIELLIRILPSSELVGHRVYAGQLAVYLPSHRAIAGEGLIAVLNTGAAGQLVARVSLAGEEARPCRRERETGCCGGHHPAIVRRGAGAPHGFPAPLSSDVAG
jgi:hypothetical protein